jgi:hypothetical protein
MRSEDQEKTPNAPDLLKSCYLAAGHKSDFARDQEIKRLSNRQEIKRLSNCSWPLGLLFPDE